MSENVVGSTEEQVDTERLAKIAQGVIFPQTIRSPMGDMDCFGLTRRELYAAMAMQGMLAGDDGGSSAEYVAHDAVKQADALLKELAK
jgi:hypothetical protein